MKESDIRIHARELLLPRLIEMGLTQRDVSDTTDLARTGVLDSFALIELLTKLEKKYGVQLDFEALSANEYSTLKGIGTSFANAT